MDFFAPLSTACLLSFQNLYVVWRRYLDKWRSVLKSKRQVRRPCTTTTRFTVCRLKHSNRAQAQEFILDRSVWARNKCFSLHQRKKTHGALTIISSETFSSVSDYVDVFKWCWHNSNSVCWLSGSAAWTCFCVYSTCLTVFCFFQDEWGSSDSSSRNKLHSSDDKVHSLETLPPGRKSHYPSCTSTRTMWLWWY